jgi:peptide/nickel transport system substrate-binding protein
MVSPIKSEFNKELKLIPYDVEAAKKLLDEAGWKDSDGDGTRDKIIDGEKIPLSVEFEFSNQGNLSKDIANMIVESAAEGGIKIDPRPEDLSVLGTNARAHNYDMLMLGWSPSALQEDYGQLWSTASWADKGSNFSGFGNAASDMLIDSITRTLDDSMRYSMSKRLQKMVYDEQPYIFLYSTYRKIAIHKRWGNQVMAAETPNLILNNLKLLTPVSTTMLIQ